MNPNAVARVGWGGEIMGTERRIKNRRLIEGQKLTFFSFQEEIKLD